MVGGHDPAILDDRGPRVERSDQPLALRATRRVDAEAEPCAIVAPLARKVRGEDGLADVD